MITISIEPADNGVIKFLFDDNVNGGGEEYTSRVVYEFEGKHARYNQAKFLTDLIIDLGINVGNEMDSNKLSIKSGWGSKYEPNESEIKTRIDQLEKELETLRSKIK